MIKRWQALCDGMKGEVEVFELEGNCIEGEPVKYVVYSAEVRPGDFSSVQKFIVMK